MAEGGGVLCGERTYIGILGTLVLGNSLLGVESLGLDLVSVNIALESSLLRKPHTEIDQVAAARGAARRHCLAGLERERMASIVRIWV
jgi:hypothetical protein